MSVSQTQLRWALAMGLIGLTAGCTSAHRPLLAADLERGAIHRILFLGDSITYDGRYVADVEACLIARYPRRTFEVINVGLPSETVSGLTEEGHANGAFDRPVAFDRLASVLENTKPDLVFACYGMNCGIYKPLDEDRFARYRDGITRLHDAVVRAGARIVHLTPPTYDAARAPDHVAEYDAVLARYSEWLLSKRSDGWDVIDIHGPMTAELKRRREDNPAFAFADDGVHPGEEGHWFIAQQVVAFCDDLDAASKTSATQALGGRAAILPPVNARMALLRDAWLTLTGHRHPTVPKGLSLEDARAKAQPLTAAIDAIARTPR